MLYAELHGKLDPNASDLERREDILTSTTFGTLFLTGATDVLVAWLNNARRIGPGHRFVASDFGLAEAQVDFWFWPPLAGVQSDLLIRIGSRLIVVEAKYLSRKSNLQGEDEGDAEETVIAITDQLVREWMAIQPTAPGVGWYPEDIRSAVDTCEPHLIYLVSARKTLSARREISESYDEIRHATGKQPNMWLLTWQDLHEVLTTKSTEHPNTTAWVSQLARVLAERRELASFLGFAHLSLGFTGRSEAVHAWADAWRKTASHGGFEVFEELGQDRFQQGLRTMQAWAAMWTRAGAGTVHFGRVFEGLDLSAIHQVAMRPWSPLKPSAKRR